MCVCDTFCSSFRNKTPRPQIQSLLEGNEPMEEGEGLNGDPDQLVTFIDEMEGKISTLQAQVAEEVVKREGYRVREDGWPESCL